MDIEQNSRDIEEDGWDIETVTESATGSCADSLAMVAASDDTIHIAYRCTVENDGEYHQALFLASREL